MNRCLALVVILSFILAGCGKRNAGVTRDSTATFAETTTVTSEPTEELAATSDATVPAPDRDATSPAATVGAIDNKLPPQFGPDELERQKAMLGQDFSTLLAYQLAGNAGGADHVDPRPLNDEPCALPTLRLSPAESEATFSMDFYSERPDFTGHFSGQAHYLVGRSAQHFALLDEYLQGLTACSAVGGFEASSASVEPLALRSQDAEGLTALLVRAGSDDEDERTLAIAVMRVHNVVLIVERETVGYFHAETFGLMVRKVAASTRSALTQLAQPRPTPTTPPTATEAPQTPTGPTPTAYPIVPPLPTITTCEQAVEVRLERFQFWLDALVDVPVEAMRDAREAPENFKLFEDALRNQMRKLDASARELGCDSDEQDRLFAEQLDQLVATSPTAQYALASLQQLYGVGPATPTPAHPYRNLPTVVPEWTIATCADAAGVFIKRTQALVLDAFAGMTFEDIGGGFPIDDAPESFFVYIQEIKLLRADFQALGCSDEDVTELIEPQLDRLVPNGEVAEELLISIRRSVSNNTLFEDIF